MRAPIAGFLVILMGIAGCVSYSPSSAPLPEIASMSVCGSEGPVKIALDPYVQGDRQKKVFGGDLGAVGIIPIQVYFENLEDRRVLVKPSNISLVLPNGTRINQAGARAACAKMSNNYGMIMAGVGLGVVAALAVSQAEGKDKAAMLDDYQRKEFQEASLEKGENAHGFLYFIPSTGTANFNAALLQVRIINVEDRSNFTTELAIKDLQYKPMTPSSVEEVQTGFRHQ
jgi:hypothetical protein